VILYADDGLGGEGATGQQSRVRFTRPNVRSV